LAAIQDPCSRSTLIDVPAPSWLSLLSELPETAVVEKKPVASAEQLAAGSAGPIAGWQTVTVHLSEPEYGLRHVLITLDEHGDLLAGSDHVMFVRATTPDGLEATLTDHESIGGRFEKDGSFRGTHGKTTLESRADDAESSITRSAEQRPPTDIEIAALRRIVDDVLKRLR
jgi:hypothetical protein